MRSAIIARYPLVRATTAEDWSELSLLMDQATNTFVDVV